MLLNPCAIAIGYAALARLNHFETALTAICGASSAEKMKLIATEALQDKAINPTESELLTCIETFLKDHYVEGTFRDSGTSSERVVQIWEALQRIKLRSGG